MAQEPTIIIKDWHNFSSKNDGSCVDIQFIEGGVRVRHSKHTDGPILTFDMKEWAAFTSATKDGQADHPSA